MPKRRKRNKNQGIEPVRHYDCGRYDECLDYAAKRNIDDLLCADCNNYEKVKIRYEIHRYSEWESSVISLSEEIRRQGKSARISL